MPLARTKAEVFDDLVLDTVETLERRYAKELAGVEFAVEDVPPDLNVYDSDVLEDGEVPLARLLPGRPGRQELPPRIVLYRRPLEFRAMDREDLADLVHDVIVEQVANLLGSTRTTSRLIERLASLTSGQATRRLSLRRSRSESPPQMPNRSS